MKVKISSKKMLAVQRKYGLSATQMQKAANILDRGQIKRMPSGNYLVQSQSDELKVYNVNPREESCQCEWAKHGNMCAHLIAYVILRDMSMDEFIAYAQTFATQRKLLDGFGGDVIARREQITKNERAAQKRTEWTEELDLQ